ncbi:hypothetical protein PQR70_21460 [Paraburkholderia madseniana]
METLIDREIAHLARVMMPSLVGGPCGPILPAQYWRWRLHRLLDAPQLIRAQLCGLDSLLLQLDAFDVSCGNRPRSFVRGRLPSDERASRDCVRVG